MKSHIFSSFLKKCSLSFIPFACAFLLVFVPVIGAEEVDLVWARGLGGGDIDGSWSITVDAAGNVYTTGNFSGTADFDPGPDTFTLTSNGVDDIFISKLDRNGDFVWAKGMGGNESENAVGIAVDSSDNVYTTGVFYNSVDFDPGAGTANLTSAGERDIFVTKFARYSFPWPMYLPGITREK